VTNAVITSVPATILPENAPHPDYLLYNRGPATVYLDSFGSVSPTTSFGLLVGASLIWNADTALYAVTANGSATLSITTDAHELNSVSNLANTIAVLSSGTLADLATYSTPILDCSAYGTIEAVVSFSYANGTSLAATGSIMRVYWYDSRGVFLNSYIWNTKQSTVLPNTVRIPVRGAYFRIGTTWVSDVPGTPTIIGLNIRGFTTELEWSNGLQLSTQENPDYMVCGPTNVNSDFFIDLRGNRLAVNIRVTSAVTVIGFLGILGMDASNLTTFRFARLDIPVAAGSQDIYFECTVAPTLIGRLNLSMPTTAGTVTINVTYPNYRP
jgi:hypothetical protein